VKLLLDTHTYLWALTQAELLSPRAAAAIEDATNDLYLSIASLWEATIKIASGKLRLPGQSVEFLLQQLQPAGVTILSILPDHLRYLQVMPRLHGDPFDRIILAQSAAEQQTIVSIDSQLQQYGAPILW
jgi:PIN domain nuclease of toxin-antitoxin system